MLELSIVVQGPVSDATSGIIDSIRAAFPRSEIILSTYDDDRVELVDRNEIDVLVLNQDPGGHKVSELLTNNVNRQIATTISGLRRANQDWVIKTRTDVGFSSRTISAVKHYLRHVDRFEATDFGNRVLIPSLYTRRGLALHSGWNLFHPSDIFLLGKKEDLVSLFDIPFFSHEQRYLAPEQHIFASFLAKRGIACNTFDHSMANLWFSSRILLSNFLIVDHQKLGLQLPKRLESGWYPKEVYKKRAQQVDRLLLTHRFLFESYHSLRLAVINANRRLRHFLRGRALARDDDFAS